MPLYMCSKCGCVENTALGGYWRQQFSAFGTKEKRVPLCSQCDPVTAKWHDKFPRKVAEGYVQDKDGYIYRPGEAEGYFKHCGPFTPVKLPTLDGGAGRYTQSKEK